MFAWLRKLLDRLFGNSKGRNRDMTEANEMEHAGKQSAAPGTPVMCHVYALGNGKFRHEWWFQGEKNQGNTTIEVPEKDVGQLGTPIQFHFHADGTGLQFDQGYDPNGFCKSIWVDQNACPTTPSKDPEITVDQMSPNLLKVTDANANKCSLHYNLRFTPDPDTNCYDPEIKNGGTK
jgi:hypothetical protein